MLRSASAALAVLGLTALGMANVAPVSSTSLQAHSVSRQGTIAGVDRNIVVQGPPGCTTGTAKDPSRFIGGGFSNYANNYSGIVEGEKNESCDPYTLVGGGYSNVIGGDTSSNNSAVTGGAYNSIEARDSFIGAGRYNIVGAVGSDVSSASAIVGGDYNAIASRGSFVGAGYGNGVYGTQFSFIGAGYENTVNANFSTIGAGSNNSVSADDSTIAGGIQNSISQGIYATIGGGFLNNVTGEQAVISGGYGNRASGKDAVIPGGTGNVASGGNTFAAGSHADAATQGSFVWSDTASTTPVTSSVANQFVARAVGGFYLYSSTSGAGVKLAPGSGAWSNLSDRNAKSNIVAVDPDRILARLDSMPVSEWSYDSEGSVRHLGPMAQDFRAAFNLGEDDKTISTVDEEGVALAAIKALKADNDAKQHEIDELRRADQARFASLEARLAALETHAGSSPAAPSR